MKKFFAFTSLLLLALSAHAASFKEGTHYQTLDLPPSSKPVVTEFFSFYCPHCYSFEPIMAQLKEQLPDNVKLQKNHVSFMGGKMGQAMSKAYATMLVLDVEDKMTSVLFRRIHDMKKPPKNEQELKEIFTDEGIDGNQFTAAFNGFAVDSMMRRFDKQFKDSGLSGVPAVIVNQRYLVKTDSIKSLEEYFQLVQFLLTK